MVRKVCTDSIYISAGLFHVCWKKNCDFGAFEVCLSFANPNSNKIISTQVAKYYTSVQCNTVTK